MSHRKWLNELDPQDKCHEGLQNIQNVIKYIATENAIWTVLVLLRLFLTTYCVRYPHAVPFLRNEMSFFSAKNSKNTYRLGGCTF